MKTKNVRECAARIKEDLCTKCTITGNTVNEETCNCCICNHQVQMY